MKGPRAQTTLECERAMELVDSPSEDVPGSLQSGHKEGGPRNSPGRARISGVGLSLGLGGGRHRRVGRGRPTAPFRHQVGPWMHGVWEGAGESGLLSWMPGSDAVRNSRGTASVHCGYGAEGWVWVTACSLCGVAGEERADRRDSLLVGVR